MENLEQTERFQKTLQKLDKVQAMLEDRLAKTNVAFEKAKAIGVEIEKIKQQR
jgi:hypothetical protein